MPSSRPRYRRSALPAPLVITIVACTLLLAGLVVHHARQPTFEWTTLGNQITALGGVATVAALLLALVQYARAEQWKRAEFVAGEMKQFFDDPKVQLVLTMIDWSPRRINLHGLSAHERDKWPVISYQAQISALLPHAKLGPNADRTVASDADAAEQGPTMSVSTVRRSRKQRYTPDEAAIRDAYDRFFDFLDRFGAHEKSGLIKAEDLDPYLKYWLEIIAAPSRRPVENAWTLSLLRYIATYGYHHVPALFTAAGLDFTPGGLRHRSLRLDHAAFQFVIAAQTPPVPEMLHLIVACAENRTIGRGGKLPWRIPEDFAFFEAETAGQICVLGRVCYETWPRARADGRRPIVVSRDASLAQPGVAVVSDLPSALALAATLPGKIMICGGQRIYAETLALAGTRPLRLHLTLVHAEVDGDTFMPEWRHLPWRETARRASADAHFRYTFLTLDLP